MHKFHILLVFYSVFFGVVPGFAAAQEFTGIETQIKIGVGYQFLVYEEKLPESYLSSDAKVSNVILTVEGLKRWRNVFAGMQGAAPVATNDSRETWSVNNSLDQSDSLEYGLYRFDLFAGYIISPYFNPIIGVRSTWLRQQRADFRDRNSLPLSTAEITEEVRAHYLLLGFRGIWPLSSNWEASYGVEYNLPFYSKVENTGLPGWEASGMDGYLWDFNGGLTYRIRHNMSLGLDVSVGRLYWDGGNWQAYSNSQVKWPENTTDFFNSRLYMELSFQ